MCVRPGGSHVEVQMVSSPGGADPGSSLVIVEVPGKGRASASSLEALYPTKLT